MEAEAGAMRLWSMAIGSLHSQIGRIFHLCLKRPENYKIVKNDFINTKRYQKKKI